ncbi:MAG: hypothetical protein JO040_03420 [Gemmatimonadetes bacterium]|nr:hypothetical protein [Gemmatimonadota bacterium]
MEATVCLNCGGRISPGDRVCPHCGAPRHRTGSPEPWPPPGARRTAKLAGAIIALLIVAVIAWVIATWPRHSLTSHEPVVPNGRV